MSVDPTTTEGRVAIGTWAKLGHDIPGHKVLALLDALDQAEKDRSELFDASLRYKYRANDFRTEARFQQARAEKAEAALDRVRALTYESDDGTEYEHYHSPSNGSPDCPACWAAGIRRALEGES